MEGRPGQPRLDLRGGVLGLGEQGRVVGAHPVGDQRDQAAEHDGGDEQGDPGRGQRGQPGPAQPGRQRLQQGGEQQGRDARHDHDVQDAEHARDQVDDDGEQQQPPGPRGPRRQPARHPALLGYARPAIRTVRPGSWPGSLAPLSSRTAAPRAICSFTPVPRAIRSSSLRPVITHDRTATTFCAITPVSPGLVPVRQAAVNHPLASRPTRRTPPRHDSIRPTTLDCMRDYRERLYVPLAWWLLAVPIVLILGGTLYAGLPWPWPIVIIGGLAAGARRC